jgi:hypothetical protein
MIMNVRGLPVVVLLLVASAPLAAQQVDVAASVPLRSPTGTPVRDLTFGAVTPIGGMAQTVDVAAAVAAVNGSVQSGAFRYDVATLRGLDFTLTVPSHLTAAGAEALPVSFTGTQYGGYCVTTGASTCTLTGFDPSAATVRVCRKTVGSGNCHPNSIFPPDSELTIYVGGLLTVPAGARAGSYTATLTLAIVQVH